MSEYALRQAKIALKVKPRKEGDNLNKKEKSRWMWRVPAEDGEGIEEGVEESTSSSKPRR